jgi:predicted transcriptional regulator of viral defense system
MTEDYTLRETVFRTFLKDPNLGPSEMKDLLGANYNSIKAIYAKLCDEGLLQREGRGNYVPNLPGILFHLMERVEALEKSGK